MGIVLLATCGAHAQEKKRPITIAPGAPAIPSDVMFALGQQSGQLSVIATQLTKIESRIDRVESKISDLQREVSGLSVLVKIGAGIVSLIIFPVVVWAATKLLPRLWTRLAGGAEDVD